MEGCRGSGVGGWGCGGGGSVLEQMEIYFRDGHETEIKKDSDK